MFQDLGINPRPRTKGGDNVCYNMQHYNEGAEDDDGDILEAEDQYYPVNGVTKRCTGAHVRFAINQRGGRKCLQVNVGSPLRLPHINHTKRQSDCSQSSLVSTSAALEQKRS